MTQASKRTIKPQPRPMTDEERAAAIIRSVAQRVESTAQGVLFNIVSNPEAASLTAEEIAQQALDIAKEFIVRIPKTVEAVMNELPEEEEKKEA